MSSEQLPASDPASNNLPRLDKAQVPQNLTGLKVEKMGGHAGGATAVISAMKHARAQMGTIRSIKTLLKINQFDGFDCPGCAWPDPDKHRATAEFCENGAKAIADEATKKRLTPAFFKQYDIPTLTEKPDIWLGKTGRITHPMVRRRNSNTYEPITWEDAFALIASELNKLDSPDEALFYTSGRTSNEAAFLYQLFVRHFGTNNLPDCSNLCHESSGYGLSRTIGIGKGTVTLDDFEKAGAILVFGQNPATNHPRMLTALQKAKRKGAKIIHINPLPEVGLKRFKNPQEAAGFVGKGTLLADLFLQVKINGDVALIKGIIKVLLEREASEGNVLDHEFIKTFTEDVDDFLAAINQQEWPALIEQSGISEKEIREAAEIIINSDGMISCWAMGITQHKNGVANVQEIVNLHLLRGEVGRPGGGLCPVRGHSNVQGDRTMGIWEKVPESFLNNIEKACGFNPPRHHGHDAVGAIEAMVSGNAKVFFGMGGNFLSATPDTEYTAEGLRNCNLTVQVSTKLNRGHLITGKQALILPCLGRTEADEQAGGKQFVTVENSMGIVHRSQGNMPPASPYLLSEPAIVAGMAAATLKERSKIDWFDLVSDYDKIRDLIEAVIPGFDDFNKRVRKPGGFYLPNGPRRRKFTTASGKAHFTVHPLPEHDLKKDEYVMMTIRSHDQYNTTIYGLNDRYRGIFNERRVVMMNENDISAGGFKAGDLVDLVGHYEGQVRKALKFVIVSFDIPRRCVATYFPETNVLVPAKSVAAHSRTPTSKYIAIKIRPAE